MNFNFILGTGRSGTYSLYKFFKKNSDYSVYHEFLFEKLLKIGTKKFHRITTKDEIIKELQIYKDSILKKSDTVNILDISNALPLLLDELKVVFPEANFIWISRNGLKVVSSFYNKFQDMMYPVSGMQKLNKFLVNGDLPEPIEDKTIWRPLYLNPELKQTRFKNICYHWTYYEEIGLQNQDIFSLKMKFENIIKDESKFKLLLENLNMDYKNKFFDEIQKPTNVQVPSNIKLNLNEHKLFNNICLNTMKRLNYLNNEYDVKY